MDANNVIIILNPVQNSNFFVDIFSEVLSNLIVQLIIGLISGIISVYFMVDYSMKKGNCLQFNRIMKNVILEIDGVDGISDRIGNRRFNEQIKSLSEKKEKRIEDGIRWIGFDKRPNPANQIHENRYLSTFWIGTLINQYPTLDNSENLELSKKITILQNFYFELEEFNAYERSLGELLTRIFTRDPYSKNFDMEKMMNDKELREMIFEREVKNFEEKFYNEYQGRFLDYIREFNTSNKQDLMMKVSFWSNIGRQLLSIFKKDSC